MPRGDIPEWKKSEVQEAREALRKQPTPSESPTPIDPPTQEYLDKSKVTTKEWVAGQVDEPVDVITEADIIAPPTQDYTRARANGKGAPSIERKNEIVLDCARGKEIRVEK